MHYEGNIIRPPSEANSILLQVTVGCSRNKCTFCGTYKGERFRIKPDDVIMEDIAFAAKYCKRQRRVFLCDGDALIIPQKRLMWILDKIKEHLPWVKRVGAYANTKGIPVWTALNLLDFLKMKDEASFSDFSWSDNRLSFRLNSSLTHSSGLTFLIPVKHGDTKISSITKDGGTAYFSIRKVKGVDYAFVTVRGGTDYDFVITYRN